MGTIFISLGILGFVIFGSLFYIRSRKEDKQQKYNLTSIFTFWKEEGFVAFIGFYCWYLIVVGIVLLLTHIEFNGVIGFIIEIVLLALPMIIVSILLKWRNS
jgi:hypothetical protein